jgi:hypothetical protein
MYKIIKLTEVPPTDKKKVYDQD